MPDADRKEKFDRDGFLVVREFLPDDEREEVSRELDRYIRDVVPTLPETSAFYHDRDRPETLKQLQHMDVDPYFDEYRKSTRWLSLAEELIGEPCAAQPPEWFNKPPGVEHPTPPHQDNFYFCLRPPNVITMWVALDPADEENGCLRYVRGSHLHDIRPHSRTNVLGFSQGITDYGPDDQKREELIRLQPGDLIVHHGKTIHLADANRSATRSRRAFAMVIQGESCQRDENVFERYLDSVKSQQQSFGLKTG